MQAFTLTQAATNAAAVAQARQDRAAYIAGGTDLLQLMKADIATPQRLVDIAGLPLGEIHADQNTLTLGALATMADVAAHPAVRAGWPAIAEALELSASPQIRNMGTMGGNLLQRTRCGYFRDTGFACNKRLPGSGCPAIAGDNRELAVFGGSNACIATHPSDLPVALMALGAVVHVQGADSARDVALENFYRLPGDTPQTETVLQPGDLITAITVPASDAAAHSRYVKVRDRTSFAFALVSVAVALDVRDGTVRDARLALGGVAPMPWRLPEVEATLRGKALSDDLLDRAAAQAADAAQPASGNRFKVGLIRQTVRRALEAVAT